MRIVNAIRYDMLFQLRHGFYYAYLFVTGIYVLALLYIPGAIKGVLTVALLFTDTVMLGFFFIGAIILLEKSQNTLESIFVTPLRLNEYFLSKTISLTLIATVSGFIIMTAANGIVQNLVIFTAGLALSSFCYTLLGLAFSAKAKSVNDYFARALGFSLVLSLPILGYLDIIHSPFLYLFPTNATLILFAAPFIQPDTGLIFYAFGCLTLWCGIFWFVARRQFMRHIIMKTGADR